MVGTALYGCGKSGEHRDEAAVVSRAIDQLREAKNEDKAPRLAALRATPCSQPDTCGVRDRCALAYATHQEGLGALSEARRTADPSVQATSITRAEQLLATAKAQMTQCVDSQGELIRAHKLGDLK
ncbi:MAG: hypothetical protein KIT72_18070 [Polyangiaceae bacterium]|nr:hypothetical protein [Polyangiaceae bacterium]MCW5792323.1 hypothetical protein [Polyangiaceae bacterium]